MWQVSFLAGLENLLFGNGLGSFSQSYYDAYAANVTNNPYWRHIPNIMHPHNEVLIHWVEMGLYGVLLVVLPVITAISLLFFKKASFSLLLLGSVLPIAIHSQTEMVLHASGAHWLLSGFIIASLVERDFLQEIKVPRMSLIIPVALGVVGVFVTITSAIAGTEAWENKTSADRALNFGLHLKRLTQGDELNHWVLGTETNDRVIKTMMAYALNTQNKSAVRKFLPRLIDQNNRWQQADSWAMIAQAYLLLGDVKAYKMHMDKIKNFDPVFTSSLEKQFNLKAVD